MAQVLYILVGICGLAVLMIVHEAGHMIAARSFGMRVTTFSIGFGPSFFKILPRDGYFWFTSFGGKLNLRLAKHDPEKHGPTVYQVAMIPFLAYVQIAGMNPFEDQDEDDKGSYANASLIGRITTIFGGPLANYLFASVFFFISFFFGGVYEQTVVDAIPDNPAIRAGLIDADRIVSVAGTAVTEWAVMAREISKNPGNAIEIIVERGEAGSEERVTLTITPKKAEDGRGVIGVKPRRQKRAVDLSEAALLSVTTPPKVVKNLMTGLGQWITGKVKGKLGGPVMIVKESARAFSRGITDGLYLLGAISAYLGAFNLIPFPALDGGRMVFLGYELVTRRKPNQQFETQVHVAGILLLLGVMLYVTIFNDFNLGGTK